MRPVGETEDRLDIIAHIARLDPVDIPSKDLYDLAEECLCVYHRDLVDVVRLYSEWRGRIRAAHLSRNTSQRSEAVQDRNSSPSNLIAESSQDQDFEDYLAGRSRGTPAFRLIYCMETHEHRRTIDDQCCICLDTMHHGDLHSLVSCKGGCGHSFHKECVVGRLQKCPLCRVPLAEPCACDVTDPALARS